MRFIFLALCAVPVFAQSAPFTLDQVLSAPFPSSLTSSPSGKIAWVSNAQGVRNIIVAEAPDYRARKATAYTSDDGQEMADLRWTPDSPAIVYVRGGSANPEHNPAGVSEDVWIGD